MAAKNLQDVLDATPNTVDLLRNSQVGAYVTSASTCTAAKSWALPGLMGLDVTSLPA